MIKNKSIKRLLIKLLLLTAVSIWLLGIILPVSIIYVPYTAVFLPVLQLTYSHVCHQIPYKCISLNEHSLLVCSRCFGIYAGMFFASVLLLFYDIKKPLKPNLLIISAMPMLIDVLAAAAGIYTYNKISAFISGAVFGSIVFAYILNIIFDFFLNNNRIDF